VGTKEFGRYVDEARRARGWSQGKLAHRLGELPESGRYFDATGIRRILEGSGVRLDRELVDHLIRVLGLDEFVAYELADLRPLGFSAEDHRTFLRVGGTTRSRVPAAATAGALSDQGERAIPPSVVLAGRRRRARLARTGVRVPVRCTSTLTASA
jgi:transcriptional regulator with XRE-family HTH domain